MFNDHPASLSFSPHYSSCSSTPSAKIIPAAAAVDPEVLRKRKERFGEVEVPTPAAKTQKKEQSAVPATQNGAAAASAAAGTPATITATPKPKVLAVGMSEEEREKMRKRAERFGLPVPELAKEAAKIE